MGRKPRKPRNDSEFEQFAAEWARRRNDPDRGAANWLVEPAGIAVDPTELMATLRVLGFITQDRTFSAARSAVIGHGLVDAAGKWKRLAILASPLTRETCAAIEQVIASGVTERLALAEAAVELNIEAASFEAAVQRVRRLVQEYRKLV